MNTDNRSTTMRLGLALCGLAAWALPAAAQNEGPAGARLGGSKAVPEPSAVTVQPLQRTSAAPAAQRTGTQGTGAQGTGTEPSARPAVPAPVVDQRPNGLSRARMLFANADQDDDGRVSLREALAQGLERPTFAGFDADGDEVVTLDEYIVGMRDLMAQAGQPIDPDLAAEATRIQALRRARAAQEQRTGGPASQRTGGVERPTVERPAVARPTVPQPAVLRPVVERPGVVRPGQTPQRAGASDKGASQRRGQVDPRRGQPGQVDPRRVQNQRPVPNLRGIGTRNVPVRPGVQRPSPQRPSSTPQRSSTRPR